MMTATKRKYAIEEIYPISMEWIVKRENLHVASSKVSIPNLEGVTFSLSLNPNGGKKEDQATVYFHLKSSLDSDITVNAIISCKTAVFEHEWINTFKKDDEVKCHNTRLCFNDELIDPDSEFFVDDKMIIGLKGTLKVETVSESEAKISKHESLGFILWESEKDKDLVIVVGDDELKAHKLVLKRRSMKFAKMLDEHDATKKEHKYPSVDKLILKTHRMEIVKEAIMWCYDIQNSEILSGIDGADLLTFAHGYEIRDLKRYMEEFCCENLSTYNACIFANSSIIAKADNLYQKCFDLIFACLKDGSAVKDIEKIDPGMKDTLFFKAFSGFM